MRLACGGVCSHACDKRRASPGGMRKKGAVVISTLYIRGRGGRRGHKNDLVGPRFPCSVFCPLAQEKMGSDGSSSARSREWVPGQCAAMDSCDHHTYHTKAEERLERRGQGDRDNRCTHSAPWLQFSHVRVAARCCPQTLAPARRAPHHVSGYQHARAHVYMYDQKGGMGSMSTDMPLPPRCARRWCHTPCADHTSKNTWIRRTTLN